VFKRWGRPIALVRRARCRSRPSLVCDRARTVCARWRRAGARTRRPRGAGLLPPLESQRLTAQGRAPSRMTLAQVARHYVIYSRNRRSVWLTERGGRGVAAGGAAILDTSGSAAHYGATPVGRTHGRSGPAGGLLAQRSSYPMEGVERCASYSLVLPCQSHQS
jgi:hypothetical protein